MTPRLQALLDDATAAGYQIREGIDYRYIVRAKGRWSKTQGIVLYGDGTAFRLDVEMSIAKGMRSYKDMREVLGIKSEIR